MTASKTTQNVRQGLSKNESLLLSSLSGDGKKIFTLDDIRKVLSCSYAYAKDTAKRLARKKWTVGLRRGTYLIVPLSAGANPRYTEHEFVIGAHLVSPYYIAYWSALNFYNFTEQTPFTVFIATTKRAESKKILDVEYKFVTLKEKKFFGFSAAAIGGSDRINISDREKTIADALDHPEYCGGITEVAKCLWNAKDSISIDKVAEYGLKMGNATIIKRLGFLVESLDLKSDKEKMTEKFMANISSGMSALDPTMPRKGRYNTRWNLLVNVSKESLSSWREEYNH